MKRLLAIPLLLLIAFALPALAQSSGQSVRVNMGVVDKADSVTLQNTGESGAAGTVAGAAIGYNLGSGKSSSKRRRHAIIGGAVGGAIGSSGTTPGMQYTVKMADGSTTVVVSDQVHIKVGECVSVEEARGMTNIREQDPTACNPAASDAVTDLQDELAEDADECAQVKQELLDAKTIEEVEIATAKAKILCN
jgi:outer membrane lipoprotein SlyB